ncbi:unnamed protein product [Nippostrongylus brasiliensis]|uniref:Detected protein of confused Function n=1 Tax=Nippostrongylus brasiliensis TaxID=27835 RepID=A0A0N4YHH4_NIPBR|nr:unnamed protein product [Nippostrongylus brasiliensis]
MDSKELEELSGCSSIPVFTINPVITISTLQASMLDQCITNAEGIAFRLASCKGSSGSMQPYVKKVERPFFGPVPRKLKTGSFFILFRKPGSPYLIKQRTQRKEEKAVVVVVEVLVALVQVRHMN